MFSPCSGSVFTAFDQTDASRTYKMNHLARRSATDRAAVIWDFHCSDSDLGFSVKGRAQKACPWVTYFYSSAFPELSIKPTQVEQEAGTITFSCNGAVKGKQKVKGGEMYAPLSAHVENVDRSSKSLTKSEGKGTSLQNTKRRGKKNPCQLRRTAT